MGLGSNFVLAMFATLTKCSELEVADDDDDEREERERRVSVSIVHSPRHLAQTGNTPEAAKWASVTATNLQTVKFIRGCASLFRVQGPFCRGVTSPDCGEIAGLSDRDEATSRW